MRKMFVGLMFAFGTIFVLQGATMLRPHAGRAADQRVKAAEVWFSGFNFAGGELEHLALSDAGLGIPAGTQFARYTSAKMAAPRPFNALVPRWQADMPEGMSLVMQVRTRPANGPWSEWMALPESHDMTLPGDLLVTGEMLTVPAGDVTHNQFQFRLDLTGLTAEKTGRVEQVGFTFIDATAGPTHAELLAYTAGFEKGEVVEGGDYPRPPVVGRDVWCVDPRCDEPGELLYEPVTHLMVHHTVTSNSGSDWAAVVRAIWFYHAITLGWEDIGYNFLVDMDGVLYEGRAGGDDVIGIHAAGANAGTMALAFIGNFVSGDDGITPPEPMLDSAAELFAWKADQKDIDVFDSSILPNMEWGLLHFSSHRDVNGTTVCPGDRAHVLLPDLRDEVAARMGFTPPHLYYDELDPATHFTPGPGSWLDGPQGCGYNVHSYYLLTTQNPGGNVQSAAWQPEVPFPGRFELEVFAPYCNTFLADTEGAVYEIAHAEGTDTITVNQEENLGLWMSLGTYQFSAGNSNTLLLSNLTATDSGLGVWFDALRLRYEGPTAMNLSPPPGAWVSTYNVTHTWSLSDPAGIITQTVRVATDDTFTDLVHQSPPLPAGANTYTHLLSADYAALFWQVEFTDVSGQLSASPPTRFGVDTTPPASAVHLIYQTTADNYLVQWQGNDALSGVAGYHVAYRAAGAVDWTPWLTQTTSTAAWFTAPMTDTVYWFYAQAVDVAGNIESVPAGEGDLSTDQAIFLSNAIMVPAIYKP